MHARAIFAAGFGPLCWRRCPPCDRSHIQTHGDGIRLGKGKLGLAVGAYLVVSALATYPAGYLADRMNPRVLNSGVMLSALGMG
jgi:hypothetical protein